MHTNVLCGRALLTFSISDSSSLISENPSRRWLLAGQHERLTLAENCGKIKWESQLTELLLLTSLWLALDTELYYLKLPFEWKCALEKALLAAAECPLPMEVFKVSGEFGQCLFLFPSLPPFRI